MSGEDFREEAVLAAVKPLKAANSTPNMGEAASFGEVPGTESAPLAESGTLEGLFEQHHHRIFRTAHRLTGRAADAEDVLQTVFLRLARGQESPGIGTNPEAYFTRAAINASLDLLRSRKRANAVAMDDVENSAWLAEPQFESGAGGLLSTIDDYFSFCRMMLNKGRHGRDQILSRAAVELMTSDQLTAQQRVGSELFFGDFSSWGFGMAVDIGRKNIYHSPGRFGWTGGFGTTAYTDPANGLIGILFTQRMMDSPEPPKVFTDFWTLAYGAME